jgi:hypothetical protein
MREGQNLQLLAGLGGVGRRVRSLPAFQRNRSIFLLSHKVGRLIDSLCTSCAPPCCFFVSHCSGVSGCAHPRLCRRPPADRAAVRERRALSVPFAKAPERTVPSSALFATAGCLESVAPATARGRLEMRRGTARVVGRLRTSVFPAKVRGHRISPVPSARAPARTARSSVPSATAKCFRSASDATEPAGVPDARIFQLRLAAQRVFSCLSHCAGSGRRSTPGKLTSSIGAGPLQSTAGLGQFIQVSCLNGVVRVSV